MAETAQTAADQVRHVLETADRPLTTAEVSEGTGRASQSDTRRVLAEIGAYSRPIATPGAGRKPEGWALTKVTLGQPHPAENGTARPARKTARKSASGRASKVAAGNKRRANAARKTTSTRKAAASSRRPAATTTAERYEATPYNTGDGAPIVTKDGQLYVVRPMVEQP